MVVKATMINERLISEINKLTNNDLLVASWLSATVGSVNNKAVGKSSDSGTAFYRCKYLLMLN